MYIAKYLTKIYVCLGSKIPHQKKKSKKRASKKRIKKYKKTQTKCCQKSSSISVKTHAKNTAIRKKMLAKVRGYLQKMKRWDEKVLVE